MKINNFIEFFLDLNEHCLKRISFQNVIVNFVILLQLLLDFFESNIFVHMKIPIEIN